MRTARPSRLLGVFAVLSLSGCWYTVREIDPNKKKHYTEEYSHTDQRKAVVHFADSLATSAPLKDREQPPVLVVYGIDNRTGEHIDTKGFTDKLDVALLKTGKVKLVNKDQRENVEKEVGYSESAKVDPAMRIQVGKQIGAEYMLTGRFSSIDRKEPKEIRLRKGRLLYYQLTLELTSLTTNQIEWKDEVEILREGHRPIIGW
jgi:uncharacterized protein (TIGR02722 family)